MEDTEHRSSSGLFGKEIDPCQMQPAGKKIRRVAGLVSPSATSAATYRKKSISLWQLDSGAWKRLERIGADRVLWAGAHQQSARVVRSCLVAYTSLNGRNIFDSFRKESLFPMWVSGILYPCSVFQAISVVISHDLPRVILLSVILMLLKWIWKTYSFWEASEGTPNQHRQRR